MLQPPKGFRDFRAKKSKYLVIKAYSGEEVVHSSVLCDLLSSAYSFAQFLALLSRLLIFESP